MKPSEWLNVATNLSVLAGLILLAYQIAQTNDALDQQSREWATEISFSVNEMFVNASSQIVENADFADIWRRVGVGEEVSPTERIRYEMFANNFFWAFYQNYAAAEQRFPDRDLSYTARTLLDQIYGKPGHEAMFASWSSGPSKQGVAVREFVGLVKLVRSAEYESP